MSEALTCPSCGGPNDCGIAQGKASCWCEGTTFVSTALQNVAAGRCICRACATKTSLFVCSTCGAPAPNEPKDVVEAVLHDPGPCPNCGTNGWSAEIPSEEVARVETALDDRA